MTTIGTLFTNAITTAMAAVAAAEAAAKLAADVAAGIGCLAVAPATSVIKKSSLLRGVTAARNRSTGEYTGKWLARIKVPNSNGKISTIQEHAGKCAQCAQQYAAVRLVVCGIVWQCQRTAQ
jgi:hypothetical protein